MHDPPCGPVMVQTARVDNLEDWQKRQNGDLNELRQEMGATKLLIDRRIDKLDERLVGLERWIMGTLAAALTGVGMTILNILSR